MTAKWNTEKELSEITEEIESCKKNNNSGNISFEGFTFQKNKIVLFNLLKLSDEITDLEKLNILSKALFDCGKLGTITPDILLEKIQEYEIEYLKIQPKRFVLLSSLSVPKQTKMKSCRANDNSIVFTSSISNKFIKEFNDIYKTAKYSIYNKLPDNYIHVKIFVSARTPIDAMNKAIKFYNFFRGIWNLAVNRSQYLRISSGPPKPVNKFLSGPLSTLHYPSGKLAKDIWWYDFEYQSPLPHFDPTNHLKWIYKYEKYVRKRLDKIKYSKMLIQSITDYGIALDSINWKTTFLNLWSVLEQLTFTNPSEGYQTTIDRVSFLCKKQNYHRIVLEQLRKLRNSFTHGNQSTENEILENIIYQLKRYVEILLEFHLKMGPRFKNLEEARNFLSLPYDLHNIKEKIVLLQMAKNFINK